MQRLPPRRGKLSAKRTDEGRVCRNCPIAGVLLRWSRACPARGLAIAARIAEAHRGRIWAESSGGINTFYFTIPI